jgi:hypothetical protein
MRRAPRARRTARPRRRSTRSRRTGPPRARPPQRCAARRWRLLEGEGAGPGLDRASAGARESLCWALDPGSRSPSAGLTAPTPRRPFGHAPAMRRRAAPRLPRVEQAAVNVDARGLVDQHGQPQPAAARTAAREGSAREGSGAVGRRRRHAGRQASWGRVALQRCPRCLRAGGVPHPQTPGRPRPLTTSPAGAAPGLSCQTPGSR